jgi:hypothetical protein
MVVIALPAEPGRALSMLIFGMSDIFGMEVGKFRNRAYPLVSMWMLMAG